MSIPFTNDKLKLPASASISIDRWYGLNYTDTISDGECAEMKNISCDGTYIFPRPSREVVRDNIKNPEKLLFCGGKLSYIAGGKLYVRGGEDFAEVGEVGAVTSCVDFNNSEMLFYPSDTVYNYETGILSEQTEPLVKGTSVTEEAIRYGEYSASCYYECNCIKLTDNQLSDEFITLSPLADDDGQVIKDDEGRDMYPVISVQCSDSTPFSNERNYKRVIFVAAWDENGAVITKSNLVGEDYAYWKFEYGEPIRFDGVYAAKLKLMAGYYYFTRYEEAGYRDSLCYDTAQADMENNDYKFWITKSEYPAPNSRPNITYACMDNNRVVAVEGNNFYASCLGNYTNWSDFVDAEGNPKATGAYAEKLYTYGDFTGIVKYKNSVVITKKDALYECYGGKPPYRISIGANVGCVDCDSIVQVGGALYWLGGNGIYRYSGGLPVNVSQKINNAFGKFVRGCAATDGIKYYIYAVGENKEALLVYDTRTGLWCKEDNEDFVGLKSFDGVVYGLTSGGTLYKFAGGSQRVLWEFETRAFDLHSHSKKIPKRLILNALCDINSRLEVYISYDGGNYRRIASYHSYDKNVIDIRLKNRVCNSFSIKLCGEGDVRLYSMEINVIKSNKTHNKNYLVRY